MSGLFLYTGYSYSRFPISDSRMFCKGGGHGLFVETRYSLGADKAPCWVSTIELRPNKVIEASCCDISRYFLMLFESMLPAASKTYPDLVTLVTVKV
jgi:hypothetical protein